MNTQLAKAVRRRDQTAFCVRLVRTVMEEEHGCINRDGRVDQPEYFLLPKLMKILLFMKDSLQRLLIFKQVECLLQITN